MRALSYRPFCPFDSRRVSLWYLSAGLRYTTAYLSRQETSYEYVWNHLSRLDNAFDRFRASGEPGVNTTYADLVTPIIKDLQKL